MKETHHKKLQSAKPMVKAKEEFLYCNLYNRGQCTESGSHRGNFGNREGLILNHVCKKCLTEKGARVGHAEIDPRCPYNKGGS